MKKISIFSKSAFLVLALGMTLGVLAQAQNRGGSGSGNGNNGNGGPGSGPRWDAAQRYKKEIDRCSEWDVRCMNRVLIDAIFADDRNNGPGNGGGYGGGGGGASRYRTVEFFDSSGCYTLTATVSFISGDNTGNLSKCDTFANDSTFKYKAIGGLKVDGGACQNISAAYLPAACKSQALGY